MFVYRIASSKHANDLSGEGARIYGGRWNPKGRSVIYTSESPALAMLEMIAHFGINAAPASLALTKIEVPDDAVIEAPDLADLPKGWDAHPVNPASMNYGSDWIISARSPILRVPSVITPPGYGSNFLLNPLHPQLFGKVMIVETVACAIDSRIASLLHR